MREISNSEEAHHARRTFECMSSATYTLNKLAIRRFLLEGSHMHTDRLQMFLRLQAEDFLSLLHPHRRLLETFVKRQRQSSAWRRRNICKRPVCMARRLTRHLP